MLGISSWKEKARRTDARLFHGNVSEKYEGLSFQVWRSRTAAAGFILDMYEMGVYDEAEAGARLYEHFYRRDAEALPEG